MKMTVKAVSISLIAENNKNHDIYNLHTPESLSDLQASIEANGILEPLAVKESEEGFVLLSGHRRLAAARAAGLDKVPCIIKTTEDESDELQKLISYNLQRRKTPGELWREGNVLRELGQLAPGRASDQIAKSLGMGSGRQFERLDAVFKSAPQAIIDKVENGEMTVSAAYDVVKALKKVENPETVTLATEMINSGQDFERAIRNAHNIVSTTAPEDEAPAPAPAPEVVKETAPAPIAYINPKYAPNAEAPAPAPAPAPEVVKETAPAPAEGEFDGVLAFGPLAESSWATAEQNALLRSLQANLKNKSVMGIIVAPEHLQAGLDMIYDSEGFSYDTTIAIRYKVAIGRGSDRPVADDTAFLVIGTKGKLKKQPVTLATNSAEAAKRDPLNNIPAKAMAALMSYTNGRFAVLNGPEVNEIAAEDGWVNI